MAISVLDIATEHEVMSVDQSFKNKKSLLIITHRLSIVAVCDMLYRFDHRVLIDRGSLENVINRRDYSLSL